MLQERRKTIEAVGVGQDYLTVRAKKVVVPDGDQRHQYRHVLIDRRVAKMLVHPARAGQEALKVFHANDQCERQSNRRPDRKPATHPVPEAESILRVATELVHRLVVGRCRREVMPDCGDTKAVGNPRTCRVRVSQCFECRECLGANDEQGILRIKLTHQVAQLRAVDVRYTV